MRSDPVCRCCGARGRAPYKARGDICAPCWDALNLPRDLETFGEIMAASEPLSCRDIAVTASAADDLRWLAAHMPDPRDKLKARLGAMWASREAVILELLAARGEEPEDPRARSQVMCSLQPNRLIWEQAHGIQGETPEPWTKNSERTFTRRMRRLVEGGVLPFTIPLARGAGGGGGAPRHVLERLGLR